MITRSWNARDVARSFALIPGWLEPPPGERGSIGDWALESGVPTEELPCPSPSGDCPYGIGPVIRISGLEITGKRSGCEPSDVYTPEANEKSCGQAAGHRPRRLSRPVARSIHGRRLPSPVEHQLTTP